LRAFGRLRGSKGFARRFLVPDAGSGVGDEDCGGGGDDDDGCDGQGVGAEEP